VDPPRKVWADFVHDTDELVTLTEGEQEFDMNGKSYRPRISDELLIPGRQPPRRNGFTATKR
jgi:hypothetical protein